MYTLSELTPSPRKKAPRISDGKLVVIAIIGVMAGFALLVGLVGRGGVRGVIIEWPEAIQQTVAIRSVNNEIEVVGILGVAQVNPTLHMRTGDFAMVLTVINEDSEPHLLYIDGLNVHTKMLKPGESQTLTFYSKNEATYNYYVWETSNWGKTEPIGQIKAIRVSLYEAFS